MATEFDDTRDYAPFIRDSMTMRSGNSFVNRWSEQTLAALRASGFLDNMVDGTVPPTIDKLWLDKNTDPAVLKEWDPVGLAWMKVTSQTLFGRVPFRGNWEASPIYRPGDLVFYGTNIWVARQPSQNHIPVDDAYWDIFINGSSYATSAQGAKADAALPRLDPLFLAGATRYPTSIGQRFDNSALIAGNTLAGKNIVAGAAAIDGLTWVNTIMPGTDGAGVVTSYSISPNGKYATVSAVRSSDNPGAASYLIGDAVVAQHDNTSIAHNMWGRYIHGWITATAATGGLFLNEESSICNLGAASTVKTPWDLRLGAPNADQKANLRLTAGTGTPANDITCALQIINNNAKYKSAIIIGSDALDTSSGYADALAFSTNHGISVYSPSNTTLMWKIFCNVTSTAAQGNLIFGDGVVSLTNADFNVNTNLKGYKVQGTQVVGARKTGWVADSGTAKRSANTTYSGTAEASYTQGTIQTLMNVVRDISQTVKAIKDDHISHGLIGA